MAFFHLLMIFFHLPYDTLLPPLTSRQPPFGPLSASLPVSPQFPQISYWSPTGVVIRLMQFANILAFRSFKMSRRIDPIYPYPKTFKRFRVGKASKPAPLLKPVAEDVPDDESDYAPFIDMPEEASGGEASGSDLSEADQPGAEASDSTAIDPLSSDDESELLSSEDEGDEAAGGTFGDEYAQSLPIEDFDDDFDELQMEEEVPTSATLSAHTTMGPPSRRPSIIDLSTEAEQPRTRTTESTFYMAFVLWCQITGITRDHYQSLLEVFNLAESLDDFKHLPRTVNTVKKHAKEQLPHIKLREADVPVDLAKLPTKGAGAKADTNTKENDDDDDDEDNQATELMTFFDPVHLFKTALSSESFRSKIHVGMAHWVDTPSELYHSLAWASSIKASSGQYAYMEDGTVLFPSDTITYFCSDDECPCDGREVYHRGRIFAIGLDHTTSATNPGAPKLLVRPLLGLAAFPDLTPADFPMHPESTELFLSTNEQHGLYIEDVRSVVTDVYYDYRFEKFDRRQATTPYHKKFVVRQTYDAVARLFDPLLLTPPIRGELELATYTRSHLLNFANQPSLCVPLLTFIDGFGLYRNMYRALLGIYVTIAGLNWRERKRRANILPLTLGPHGADFATVIEILKPGLTSLDNGLQVTIGGKETFLSVFTLAFTGDMKQQMESSGLGSALAILGCSKCLATKEERADLTYNTHLHGRTHHRILQERRKAKTMKDGDKYLTKLNMKHEESPLVAISPSLDLIQSRPLDAAHSEFGGIAKQSQYCLLQSILTPAGLKAYSKALRHFPFPPGWGRLQSVRHLKLYRMQECGRLSIITPLVLRTHLRPRYVQRHYLRAVKDIMTPYTGEQDVDVITACYASIARSNTAILSTSMTLTQRDNLKGQLLAGRKAFQVLFECASLASSSVYKKGGTPISS